MTEEVDVVSNTMWGIKMGKLEQIHVRGIKTDEIEVNDVNTVCAYSQPSLVLGSIPNIDNCSLCISVYCENTQSQHKSNNDGES